MTSIAKVLAGDYEYPDVPVGCLREGTQTPLGVIEAVSVTAYRIEGKWVPHARIHGEPKRAEALAIPQEWVDAVTPEMARQIRVMSDLAIDILKGGRK